MKATGSLHDIVCYCLHVNLRDKNLQTEEASKANTERN